MGCKVKLTEGEILRYSRQIRLTEIGREGQEQIKGATVLVVGAGALGSAVLQYLTAAGVGRIGILDNDSVEETNLQRQVLYSSNDVGKPKPLAARDRLKQLNPYVALNIHFLRLARENAIDIMRNYEIIVDCTDNFPTRYLINDAAVILGRPVVYGAIHRFSGQVIVFNYNNGPTLRCIYPIPPHPLEVPSCDEVGVLGSIAGIIGSVQANEVIKIILESPGVLSERMFFLDSLNFNTQLVSFTRDPVLSKISVLGDYDEMCLTGNDTEPEVSLRDLKTMIEKNPGTTVVDLSDENDNSDIGIECLSIPYYEISQKVHLLPENAPVVFYCKYGIKSSIVINYLRKVHKKENLFILALP